MEYFEIKPLPYAYNALEPVITAETLTFHHDKHYVGYVTKLNELVEGTPFEKMSLGEVMQRSGGAIYNNAAQAVNHEFYFDQFSPTPKVEPTGKLLSSIVAKFGSFERFKERMLSCATTLFGSGWVWLVADERGILSIINESNAGNPMIHGLRPILTIDVWEHAYYIDYRNNRKEAVEMFWNVVDWELVEARY